jgi:hypothetical protein
MKLRPVFCYSDAGSKLPLRKIQGIDVREAAISTERLVSYLYIRKYYYIIGAEGSI